MVMVFSVITVLWTAFRIMTIKSKLVTHILLIYHLYGNEAGQAYISEHAWSEQPWESEYRSRIEDPCFKKGHL